ncbi:hypothetical protein amrb99_97840 [Actinomadura sp. RB99]|uniref:hypothetical protein n=1 Tax=Actinomadura sp. RB99 TaxID=2691577 RepID=UPI0016885C07|nr:hypothetical protein [Actinomadura sp. RB99]MBD2900775.1 hypothetical protein [Actinomadura sp. RB99]
MSIIHYVLGLWYLLLGPRRSDAEPALATARPTPAAPRRASVPTDYPLTADVRDDLAGRGHTVSGERLTQGHATRYVPGRLSAGDLVIVERTDGRLGTVAPPPRGAPPVTAARRHARDHHLTYIPRGGAR